MGRWRLWVIVLVGILLLNFLTGRTQAKEAITQHQLESMAESGRIIRATIFYDNQSPLNRIEGVYSKTEGGQTIEVPFEASVRLTAELEQKLLSLPQSTVAQPNTIGISLLVTLLPFVFIALFVWFFFIRRLKLLTGTPTIAALHTKEAEQQNRFDKVLDKWEQQAHRMDGVLDKLDKNAGKPPE